MAHQDRNGTLNRLRRWRPNFPGRLIANVNNFAGGVVDRIIAPGRDLVGLTVAHPGVAGPTFGHDEAATFVGYHINPRRRGMLLAFRIEPNHVFFAALGEAA